MQIENDGYPNPQKQGNFSGCLITIVLFFLFLGFFPSFNSPSKTEVSYSEFRNNVRQGKVGKVIVKEDRVEYFLKTDLEKAEKSKSGKIIRPEKTYVTIPLPQDQTLPKLLEDNNVEFGVQPSGGGNWVFAALSWVIPPFLFFLIIACFANRASGGGASNPLNPG